MIPILVGLDWGTSALRAYLVAADGAVIERRESPHGIRALPEGGFAAAFAEAVRDWPPRLPVLMSGMVGSRAGWREAPYLDAAPDGVGLGDLAAALLPVDAGTGGAGFIVPGVRSAVRGEPDVMRGEETQVLGLGERADALFLLPGTHSKWVRVAGGRIVSFRTAMTGEVFAALADHTILAQTMPPAADAEEAAAGFAAGLSAARAMRRPGELLARLFRIRASVLEGEMRPGETRDFLSGLLIGAEISGETVDAADTVRIVGGAALTKRYASALDAFDIRHETAPADAAAKGLHAIAAAARLI